ncbi:TPA: class I SAM-dependent methyltransferase [Kluyvera georgiana]|nr:class I SAM-dependent methyltransferase [Kluyvera georgiana]
MSTLKKILKSFPFIKNTLRNLDNQNERDDFVIRQLSNLPSNKLLLDAGCGSQRYRQYCSHLQYKTQDFGQYTTDQKKMIGTEGVGGLEGYQYGQLDYIGDIWNIQEKNENFDAILCTEVLEHIPYPIETIKEFSRLLKKNGILILTAPSNCLRHMDPYFFYTGFSDRWYEKFLNDYDLEIISIEPVGDYYSWLSVEMARAAHTHSIISKILLAPAFLYFYNKNKTNESINTLCMGYHIVAKKK